MKKKRSRYLIIIFLLIGVYPLMSIFTTTNSLMVNTTKYKTFAPSENGNYYSKNAYHEYLGNGKYRFSTKAGAQNVYDGSKYIPYIYDPIEHSVQFANSKLTFFDWYAVLEQKGEMRIYDIRWTIQYWQEQAGGRWNELDLWNHYFYAPIMNEQSMIFIQAYDDGLNYMNVSYTISNYEGVKVAIDFLSGGDYELRFNWQLTGMQGDINVNMTERTFSFDDVHISCNDTDSSINFDYDWAVQDKKLDIYLGSYNILAGEKIFIDPTFSGKQTVGENDFRIYYWTGGPRWYMSSGPYMVAGDLDDPSTNNTFYIAYDTGITSHIYSTSEVNMTFYVDADLLEADEYLSAGLYFNSSFTGGFWNESSAEDDEIGAYLQQLYWNDEDFFINPDGTGNKSIPDAKAGGLIDEWVTHHNLDPVNRSYIPMRFSKGLNCGQSDYLQVASADDGVASNKPTLTFDYSLEEPTTTTTTTTTTGELVESFTDEYEFFLIHFLNNLALFLAQHWVIVLGVSAIIIILIKILYS